MIIENILFKRTRLSSTT